MAPTNSDPATDLKQNAPHIRARPTRKDMNMNRWKTFTGALALFAMCSPAFAAVNIFASAAHSGRQAKMLTAANAGEHMANNARAPVNVFHRFMFMSFRVGRARMCGAFCLRSVAGSEFVGAMRAEAHDVLQEHLVVGLVEAGFVARELQPETRKLRR